MKKILFAIIFISPPFFKKILLKTMCNASLGRSSRIGWFSVVAGAKIRIGDFSVVKPFTLIRCDGDVEIGKYTEIAGFSLIYGSANFKVGDKCYLGPQLLFNVTDDILIGNEVGIGHRTMIFTHGSQFPYSEGYWVKFGRVIINNRVWLGAGVFIHPGIEIGDDVFINSRSVVTKNVPSGKVMEGYPAKAVIDIEKIRRSVSPQKKEQRIYHIIKHFASYISKIESKVEFKELIDNDFVFKCKGLLKRISIIGPGNKSKNIDQVKHDKNTIFLFYNRKITPEESVVITYFDFTEMKASYSREVLFRELYLFMKRHYGLLFEYQTK